MTKLPLPCPQTQEKTAATKIQSKYKSHLIRTLTKALLSVNSKTTHLQNQLQTQETVDKIRSSEKERVKMSESLMELLLKLDSVRGGFDENVRDVRRRISRKITELLEILDCIVKEDLEFDGFVEFQNLGEFCQKIWLEEQKDELKPSCDCDCRCLENFFRGM